MNGIVHVSAVDTETVTKRAVLSQFLVTDMETYGKVHQLGSPLHLKWRGYGSIVNGTVPCNDQIRQFWHSFFVGSAEWIARRFSGIVC